MLAFAQSTYEWDEGPPQNLIARCRRRWYVTLLGLAATVVVAMQISAAPGVYWAHTTIVLLAPTRQAFSNQLTDGAPSLIATAGVLEREINGSVTPIPAVDNNVSILDQGVVNGVRVRVPNYGGQWATNFTQPVLQLEVAGRDRAEVLTRMGRLVDEARAILQSRQDAAGVNSLNRITLLNAPAGIEVDYVRGHLTRATALTALLGLCATAAVASGVDDRLRRRSSLLRQAQR